jgi:hypothetical protein
MHWQHTVLHLPIVPCVCASIGRYRAAVRVFDRGDTGPPEMELCDPEQRHWVYASVGNQITVESVALSVWQPAGTACCRQSQPWPWGC